MASVPFKPILFLFFSISVFSETHGQLGSFIPPQYQFKWQPAQVLKPAQERRFTKIALESALPQFVKSIIALDDVQREATLRYYLKEIDSSQCGKDLISSVAILAASLASPDVDVPTWLLHMVDAWGKIPYGILSGNTQSTGDFLECIQMRAKYSAIPSLELKEFKGSYCTVMLLPMSYVQTQGLDFNSSVAGRQGFSEPRKSAGSIDEFLQLLTRLDMVNMIPVLGTCMPSTCSMEQQQAIFSSVVVAATGGTIFPAVIGCQTDEKPPFGQKEYAVISVLVIIGSLCFVGTLFDFFVLKRRTPEDKEKGLSTGEKFWLGFSVYENGKKVLSTEAGGRTLGCLNGLRFLSMAWVILGHTFLIGVYQPNANMVDMKKTYDLGWQMLAVLNSTVSVDTFFVISGLLVAYNLLRELDKTKGFKEFAVQKVPLMYINRYLRLTPTFLILIGVLATLYPYMSEGPSQYIIESESNTCVQKWWQNILYINTVMDNNGTMCMGESWYLANDMIFFVLSPLIIYPLWLSPVAGFTLLGLGIGGTISANFYLIAKYDLIPTSLIGVPAVKSAETDVKVYMAPWTRVGPYLIGIFVGYLLHKAPKPENLKPPKWLLIIGWTTSTVLALVIIFGPYEFFNPDNYEIATTSFRALLYGSLHRNLWACIIGWIIFACVKGHGGVVNRILCWEAFIPLSRLTYCAYMVSLHMQFLYHLGLMHPVIWSPYFLVHAFFAHMVFVRMVSFGLIITIESPFMNITKLIFGR